MADDERPEPTPAPEPEPIPEEPTVESLQAELEDAKHARELYEQTLQSLQAARAVPPAQAQPAASPQYYDPVVPGADLTRSQIDRIKARGGFQSDEEAAAAVKWARPILEELAAPLVTYMAQLADIADRHEARLSVEGYADLQDEIEKEQQLQRSRGSHLPRTEIAQIVKARRLPAILAKDAERKKSDKAQQVAQRRAQGGTDVSVQKVGPSVGGGGRSANSIDKIKELPSREDRIKALEELAGNRAG